jgi:uncharacterized Zn-binding protein involved in type VI secretion
MPPVTRLGDMCSGHGCHPPRKSIEGSHNVFVNSIPAHRRGDGWAVHICPPKIYAPHGSVLAEGSKTVYVNGRPLGRANDPIACGSVVLGASNNVFAGDSSPPVTPLSDVPVNITKEHEDYMKEGIKTAPKNSETFEYGDGGISNGDGGYLSNNTSPVNNIQGPQNAPANDNSVPFERVDDPTLNFLSHTDSRIEPALKNILIEVAKEWGRTLDITSAYRSPEYNKKVGGAKGSMHQQGKATDIIMSSYSKTDRARFIDICVQKGIKGVGLYNTFTHIDIGGKRAWGSNGSRTSIPKFPWAIATLKKHGYATG